MAASSAPEFALSSHLSTPKAKPPRSPNDRKPVTWKTREASADDMAGILACRAVTFAGEEPEKGEPDYWNWEFVDNHAGPARLFVAEDESKTGTDRIVGHYAVIPQRVILDDKMLRGSIVVDVMTHPDYRFQGMFTKIGRCALDHCATDPNIEFTTGYPIRPEVIPGHLKVGWRIRFGIGTYVMPLAAGRVLASRFRWLDKVPGLAALVGALPGLGLWAWSQWRLRRRGTYRVKRLDRVHAELFDKLWQQVRSAPPAGCLLQERTSDYLKWRFDDNPHRTYRYHVATDADGECVGWMVSRIASLLDAQAMIVVDACVLPGLGPELMRALIADVRDLALEQRCPMLAAMVTQPNPFFPAPGTLGFLATPHEFQFITKPLEDGTLSERDDLQWHLMWGDTDDI